MNFQVFFAKYIITWRKYRILDNLVPYLAAIGPIPSRYVITRGIDVVLCQRMLNNFLLRLLQAKKSLHGSMRGLYNHWPKSFLFLHLTAFFFRGQCYIVEMR